MSLSSATTTTSQDQWKLIQQELKSVGITAAQLNANRETVIDILRDAFPESDALASPSVKIKKAGQMSRLLSTLTGGSNDLLTLQCIAAIQDVLSVLSTGAGELERKVGRLRAYSQGRRTERLYA